MQRCREGDGPLIGSEGAVPLPRSVRPLADSERGPLARQVLQLREGQKKPVHATKLLHSLRRTTTTTTTAAAAPVLDSSIPTPEGVSGHEQVIELAALLSSYPHPQKATQRRCDPGEDSRDRPACPAAGGHGQGCIGGTRGLGGALSDSPGDRGARPRPGLRDVAQREDRQGVCHLEGHTLAWTPEAPRGRIHLLCATVDPDEVPPRRGRVRLHEPEEAPGEPRRRRSTRASTPWSSAWAAEARGRACGGTPSTRSVRWRAATPCA